MMKSRLFVGCLLVALVVLLAPAGHAQTFCPPPNNTVQCPVVGVGSSGAFAAMGIAAVSGDPVTGHGPLCGSRFWTGTGNGKDARSTITVEESASMWIAWDNDTAPTIVCEYLAVDSVVGQRLFFGQNSSGNSTIDIPLAACTQSARGNKVSFVWDNVAALPVKVWNALMGGNATLANCSDATATNPAHFNVAFTDVRTEDAKYIGSDRVLCNDSNTSPFEPPDAKGCLGFGPGAPNAGTTISSSFSGAGSHPVAYNISGNDPINTNQAIPAFQQLNVAAQVMLVFVNTIDTTANGFGTMTAPSANPRLTNAGSHELSAFYSGSLFFTRDLLGATPNSFGQDLVHLLAREPLSGTYTNYEWQVIRQNDGRNDFSQETGVCGPSQGASCGYSSGCVTVAANKIPATNCSNPMSFTVAGTTGLRNRVIGTGQMIATGNNGNCGAGPVNSSSWVDSSGTTCITPSVLGYAYWSLGNFGAKSNIKYLTLDGIEPLQSSYSVNDGNFPGVTAGQGTTAILGAPGAKECDGYFNGDGGVTVSNFACGASYTLPTFDNIQNGNYRLWNIIRADYYGSSPVAPSLSPLNVTGFIQAAQDQAAPTNPIAHKIPDFFPTSYCANAACSSSVSPLLVFRSHYGEGGIPGNNGINGVGGATEAGGDVAGSVFNVQAELDTGLGFSNNTFLTYIQ